MNKKSLVLNHLKSGKTITSILAWNKFQTLKLQDIVFKLRNNGYNIVTEMKKNKSTNSIYAVYKLNLK